MIYTEFQLDLPVFVRSRYYPFTWKGKTYKWNDEVPWAELSIPEETIRTLFKADKLYHNSDLEVKHEVGDRLAELELDELLKLTDVLNLEIKKRTHSQAEFNKYKIKKSTAKDPNKQRLALRRWRVNHLEWAADVFKEERDKILAQRKAKEE